eukprot:6093930-Prymnesium_polylepis.1
MPRPQRREFTTHCMSRPCAVPPRPRNTAHSVASNPINPPMSLLQPATFPHFANPSPKSMTRNHFAASPVLTNVTTSRKMSEGPLLAAAVSSRSRAAP